MANPFAFPLRTKEKGNTVKVLFLSDCASRNKCTTVTRQRAD